MNLASHETSAVNTPPQCPVCGSKEARRSFAKDGFRHYSCSECDLLFLFPVPSPEELDAYYVAGADDTRSSQCWEREDFDYRHYEPIWERALESIERSAGRGPLLDVGCGGGQFLAFARERGWSDLVGVEPSPPAAAHARSRTGAEILETDFLSCNLEPERFSGVTMWNVIEHTPTPRLVLRQVRRILGARGTFVADCPNRYGLTMRIIGKEAFVVMPPEHLAYFSHRSLRALLEPEGFQVSQMSCNTIYVNDWVRFLSKPKNERSAHVSHLNWYARLTSTEALLKMIDLVNVVLDKTRLGDQMLVVAEKR